jgi:hypothetical protein
VPILPSDRNVLEFLAAQNNLRGLQLKHELMHMAGSFGRPGSLTEGGRLYKQTSYELDILNLQGVIYAIQQGYADVTDVKFPESPFKLNDLEWEVSAA